MPDKSFSNELQRALARADVEILALNLEAYRQWIEACDAEKPDEWDHPGNSDDLYDAHNDPDRALAYLALAASRYDDPYFLGVMAAGPLEDILRDPTREVLERVRAEARKTPRFRWMLSGVWLHAIAERAREPVNEAIGGWSLDYTPLPERPWA